MHEYVGAIHIHSNYSDGLRPIPEIVDIAAQCSIDFLMFADHNTLEPLKVGLERWFGSVLSIIGYETNDDDNKNHENDDVDDAYTHDVSHLVLIERVCIGCRRSSTNSGRIRRRSFG